MDKEFIKIVYINIISKLISHNNSHYEISDVNNVHYKIIYIKVINFLIL